MAVFYGLSAMAQIEYKDVASVFYSRCTSCHHSGGSILPYMNYSQTAASSAAIQNSLTNGSMPPWNADTNYTRFQHERIITLAEKQLILNWISGGSPAGDTSLAPLAPTYSNGYQLDGIADLTLSIGAFTSTAVSSDKYYCFSLPTNLTQDRILRAFELVPGNKPIVHHAVITADTTGNYTSDLSGNCYSVPGNLSIGTYAPGTAATVFPGQTPLKAGMKIKAGTKIIIQLHYPAGSAGQIDSTKIRLYFYPQGATGIRSIYSSTPLQNWSMVIPANTNQTFSAYYPSASTTLPVSLSAFAVMPHSHLLCKRIVNYAVNPGIDTIKLVRINDWNFEWQDYYKFNKLVKIPAGYRLCSKHFFDNTVNNPNNPNSPPVTVFAGPGTNDEMLFDGMMYLLYQPGDELIDVAAIMANDPLLQTPVRNTALAYSKEAVAYPNPFSKEVNLSYELKQRDDVRISILNLLGKEICSTKQSQQSEGLHDFVWSGRDATGNQLSAGVYFYTISTAKKKWQGKLIKQ